MMFERIRNAILERDCPLAKEEITPETDFYVDLGWTSLDMVGCITDFEDETGKEIPDETLSGISTVGDLSRVLESL